MLYRHEARGRVNEHMNFFCTNVTLYILVKIEEYRDDSS